jgi:hypothetical protein
MWGKLTVRPINATLTKDTSHLDYLDPYVTLQVGDQHYQTSVAVNQGGNQTWNDQITFLISKDDRLRVKVMDRNATKDDFIGKVNIRLSQLIHQPHLEEGFDLRSRFLGRYVGRIFLSFDWVPSEGFSQQQRQLQQGYGLAAQTSQQVYGQHSDQFSQQGIQQQQFLGQQGLQQQLGQLGIQPQLGQQGLQQQLGQQRLPQQQQQQFVDQRTTQQYIEPRLAQPQQYIEQRQSQQLPFSEQRVSQHFISDQRIAQQPQYQYTEQRVPIEQRAYLTHSPYQRQYVQPSISQAHYISQPFSDLSSSQYTQQPTAYTTTRSSENLIYTAQPRYVQGTISPSQYQTNISTASVPISNVTYRQPEYVTSTPQYSTTYTTRSHEYSPHGRVGSIAQLESQGIRSGLHGPVTTVIRADPYQVSDQYAYAQTRVQQPMQYSQINPTTYTDYHAHPHTSFGQTEQIQSNPLKEMVVIKQEETIIEEVAKTHPESSKPTLYDQQAQVSATQNQSSQNRQNQQLGTGAEQSNREFETRAA